MKSLIFAVSMLVFGACNSQEEAENNQKMEKVELSNKQKAVALLTSLETGDHTPVSYINPNKYIQHNLMVGDGLEGFGAIMQHAPEGGFKANVVRAFEDSDFVFTHTVYDFFGPKVGFDIFRFENGLIVEHWDNLAEITPANPSGRSQTDGASQIADLANTNSNKALVKDFVAAILQRGEVEKIGNYIDGENYIQHNSNIGDGLSGLGKALEYMASEGITMEYHTIHKVLGEGNFVLTVSEGEFAGAHSAFYDLFRVESGKIVEHWDIIEPILAKKDWKNNNGKF
jgi:predicted SnoaL-like aldol condensation-catalyzing enzyme